MNRTPLVPNYLLLPTTYESSRRSWLASVEAEDSMHTDPIARLKTVTDTHEGSSFHILTDKEDMGQATPFEAHQRIRVSLQSMDTSVGAEVVSFDQQSMRIKLVEPLIGLEPHHLDNGIKVSFWRSGGWYVSDSVRVIAFDLDAGTLHVARPRKTAAIQRRQAFRENVELPVHIAVVGNLFPPSEIGHETVDLAAQSGITADLSGGGVCLQSMGMETNLRLDQEIRLELELPNHRIQARGKIRWATYDDDGQGRYGVMFTRISEREQDMVYGFLFDLQRYRLRQSAVH